MDHPEGHPRIDREFSPNHAGQSKPEPRNVAKNGQIYKGRYSAMLAENWLA